MRELIDADGWLVHPDFVRVDGHPLKVYTQENSGAGGLACHSIVGEEGDDLDGVPNRFLDDRRNADGSFVEAASCMFILRKRAPHVVMYPVTASTWTTGGREANTTMWAMEAEGGGWLRASAGERIANHSEPLTEHQVRGFLIIATAWEMRFRRQLQVGSTVEEHGVIAKRLGYAATACASKRYRLAMARLAAGERYTEEDEDMGMIEELKARLDRLEALAVANGIEEWVTDDNRAALLDAGVPAAELAHAKVTVTGEAALRYAALRGWSVALGLGQVRDRVAALEKRPSGGLPEVIELTGGTLKVKVSK